MKLLLVGMVLVLTLHLVNAAESSVNGELVINEHPSEIARTSGDLSLLLKQSDLEQTTDELSLKAAPILKEIERYSSLLKEDDANTPLSFKNNYEAFIQSYTELLTRIKEDRTVDVESELFLISERLSIFSGGFYS